jgi:hypothetical protein
LQHAASIGALPAASYREAASSVIERAAYISVWQSASIACTSWKSAIREPNCLRSVA